LEHGLWFDGEELAKVFEKVRAKMGGRWQLAEQHAGRSQVVERRQHVMKRAALDAPDFSA